MLPQTRPKIVLETTSCPTPNLNRIWLRFRTSFDTSSMQHRSRLHICLKRGFTIDVCFQHQGSTCFQEDSNPSKQSECCSTTDFAHSTTYVWASSSLGSNLVSTSITCSLRIDPQNASKTNVVVEVNLKYKISEKRLQYASSELIKLALGRLWPPQSYFLVSKTPSHALKLLILTSYGSNLDAIFNMFKLFWHQFKSRIRLQSLTHSTYNEDHSSKRIDQTSEHNLDVIVHHLVFIIREHASCLSADVPAFKVPAHKSQQHTYTYVHTMDSESLITSR